jgi:hypothetical protein
MDVRLAICLWHAPFDAARRADRIKIERALGGQAALAAAGVAYRVSPDPIGVGCWRSWRAAAQKSLGGSPEATHHLVLADDMLPCRAFLPAVVAALAAVPEHPVNLFSMRRSQERARDAGQHWVVSPDGIWGGSVVLPTPFLRGFFAWEPRHCRPGYKWEDVRLRCYAKAVGLAVFQTAPALLQHLRPDTSLVGNQNRTRVARWWVDDGSVAAIDWAVPPRPIRDPGHDQTECLLPGRGRP